MNIELHAYGPIKDKGVLFLQESNSLVSGFAEVYRLLNADPAEYWTREFKQMGLSAEECLLERLEETLTSMNISALSDIISRGYFGPGLSSGKYLNAHATLMSIFTTLQGNINCMIPITADNTKKYSQMIRYALGDMLFALSKTIYDPIDAKQFLELDESYTLSHDLQVFFSSLDVEPEQYAAKLCEMRAKFISVIPLFEDDPEQWATITSGLPDSIVDTLVDYGVYITDFDLRAYSIKALLIDENFIDELCTRAENSAYIGNVAPHKWQQFTSMLSDSQVAALVSLTDAIAEEDIDPAIQDGKITDSYFNALLRKCKGDSSDTTSYFE